MNGLSFTPQIRRYWWLPLATLLAGGTSSAYFTQGEPIQYEASATVVVGPSDQAGSIETSIRSLDAVSRRNVMATYAQIPSSRTVRGRVGAELELTRKEIRPYRVRTSVLPDTNLIRIAVRGPSAQRATDVANAAVRQSQELAREFYDGIAAFRVLDPAVAPSRALESGAVRKIALGGLLGLLLGVGLAFVIEHLRGGEGNKRHAVAPEGSPIGSVSRMPSVGG